MIEPLLASKNLCNLADVLKYPRSAKQPCALPRHVEATLKFPCCSLGAANWIDTLFRGRSHNSLAKKASCSELAPAHLKKWQKNQILTLKTASNLKPFLASNLKPFLASTIKKWKRQAQKLKPKLASKKWPFSTQGILNAGLHSLHFCWGQAAPNNRFFWGFFICYSSQTTCNKGHCIPCRT